MAKPQADDVAYERLEGADPSTAPPADVAKDGEGTSMAGTVALIANTVMGAGVLSLPYAYARAGVAGGPALVIGCGLLNIFTMHCLSAVGRKISGDDASFHAIAASTMPKSLWWAVDAIIVVMMMLLDASYLIVFANLSTVAANSLAKMAPGALGTLLGNRMFWVVVGVAVVVPMAYAKSLGILKYTSALGLGLALYVGALAAASWVDRDALDPCEDDPATQHHCGGDYELTPPLGMDTLVAFALCTFAYTAQSQIPAAANGLANYSQRRMDLCSVGAVAICAMLYCVVGQAGYETFGALVNSDLLESYRASPAVTMARVAVAVVVATSYPLMVVPFRTSLSSILRNQTSYPGIAQKVEDGPEKFHWYSTTVFIGVTTVIAMFVTDLGLVLSIVGSTASTAIAYAIPSWAYLQTYKDDPTAKWHCRGATAVLIYASIAGPACLASTFL